MDTAAQAFGNYLELTEWFHLQISSEVETERIGLESDGSWRPSRRHPSHQGREPPDLAVLIAVNTRLMSNQRQRRVDIDTKPIGDPVATRRPADALPVHP